MRENSIVVVDSDPLSYQVVQNCFYYQAVDVIWVKKLGDISEIPAGAKIVLAVLDGDRPYDFLADISDHHPDTVLFILSSDKEGYDSFEARNAGVVGAFFKPLHFDAVQSRLEEFLDLEDMITGPMEIPALKERRASLLSFYRDTPQDIEEIVQESLPVLIEKILQLQLRGNTTLKRMLTEVVREVVHEEMEQYHSVINRKE